MSSDLIVNNEEVNIHVCTHTAAIGDGALNPEKWDKSEILPTAVQKIVCRIQNTQP